MSEDFVKNANPLKTMLIIVYDDHGGFYEHVDSLAAAVARLGQNSGKLGPRVPGFVVSPWTPARPVLKDTFSHVIRPSPRRFRAASACPGHPS